jgi:DNA polymerase (family 10)
VGDGQPADGYEGGAPDRPAGRWRGERLTLFHTLSRADLEALPRALSTLAAGADVVGDRLRADALLRAAPAIEELPPGARRELVKAARHDGVTQPALAVAAIEALRAFSNLGLSAVVDAELERLPADLSALLRLPDLDPTDVIRVHRRHGAVTVADIAAEAALDAARDDDDAGSSAALSRLVQWLPAVRGGRRRIPLGRAVGITEWIADELGDTERFGRVRALGSIRRFEPTVGDIDVLLVHGSPAEAMARALARLAPDEIRHCGQHRAVVRLQGEEVALRACAPAEAAYVSLWHTGSAAHVRQLRRRALAKQFDLGLRHLRDASGRALECQSEDDVYRALGLVPVPPEMRHGDDELERADAGQLPRCIELSDIQGDLHTHTLFSDGRDSVETMVHAARTLGYDYVAITDHSPSAAASRVLSLDRIARQMEDVERARRRVSGIAILYGVEVDILPDGSLDLPGDVLARLDIVLASLHEPAGHGAQRLLERYLSAMHHPRVNVITHPANRLVGRDEGYDLDYDALFEAAVETNTALEIDGGPGHLDLDGRLARRAVAAGVTLTIDSDCHNALRLGRQMRMGVGTARRGGVEARHVLNTRPLVEVTGFFAEKRRRFGLA